MADSGGKAHRKIMDANEVYNIHIDKRYRLRGPLAGRGLELGIEISHCGGY